MNHVGPPLEIEIQAREEELRQQKQQKFWRNVKVFSSLGILLILSVVCSLLIEMSYIRPSSTRNDGIICVQQQVIGKDVCLFTRDNWGAKTVATTVKRSSPIANVVVAKAAMACSSPAECRQALEDMQAEDILERNFHDIADNFLIGGDGNVYEGRGWTLYSEHHPFDSMSVSFIENEHVGFPSAKQLSAFRALIMLGISEKKVANNYTVTQQGSEKLFPVSAITIT